MVNFLELCPWYFCHHFPGDSNDGLGFALKKMHLCCYQSFTMKKDLYKYSRAYSLPVFEPVFKKSVVWSSRCSFVLVDPSLRFFLGVHKEWDGIVWLPKTSFWPSWPNFLRHFFDLLHTWFLEKLVLRSCLKRMQVPKKLELVLGGALLRQAFKRELKKNDGFPSTPACHLAGFV